MKKVVSFKFLLIGLLSIIIIGVTTSSFATDSVLESGNNTSTPTAISASEYQNASVIPTDNNTVNTTTGTSSSTTSTTTSTGTSTNSVYNTIDEDNTNKDTIPQTGIEDGYVGILLIVFVAASIFAYKKMKDYKNI